jgi:tetratricopeptide (TPR) repeat protein
MIKPMEYAMLSLRFMVHAFAPHAVHRNIEGAAEVDMKSGRSTNKTVEFRAVIAVAALLLAGSYLRAQSPAPPPAAQTKQTDKQKPAQQPQPSNPFPEDTNNIPVLPNSTAPAPEPPPGAAPGNAPSLPAGDVDPVRSPDEPLTDTSSSSSGASSSSSADLANIIAPPHDEEKRKSRKNNELPADHTETAREDENVGGYYLDQKNWRAALSRFQSALVLDPENPDVYWGLAESQRHLGDVGNAKSNYQKVMEYDPGSKHAKEASKLLKEPEMAKAPAAPPSR